MSDYGHTLCPSRSPRKVPVDLIRRFKLPLPEIFLVLKNGRDITPGLYQGGVVNEEVVIDDGDVIAFSGAVPYSPGFGRRGAARRGG